jgi:hypothetical protein
MHALATPLSTLAALVLPLAVAAQGYPVMADPMAPGVPPGAVIGAPAMGVPAMGAPAVGAPAVGAPLVGAPAGGAPYGGSAVVVSPGQAIQGGYVITPQNSWGTGVVTPGNPPTYIVPNNAGGTAIVTPGAGYGTPTLIRPNPAGGTTIIGGPNPGTTVIAPTGTGGAVIVGPGGTGYAVPTPHGTYIQPPGGTPPAVIYRP